MHLLQGLKIATLIIILNILPLNFLTQATLNSSKKELNKDSASNEVKGNKLNHSKHHKHVDEWSKCECGEGLPGKQKKKAKKNRLLKVVSGYVPNR